MSRLQNKHPLLYIATVLTLISGQAVGATNTQVEHTPIQWQSTTDAQGFASVQPSVNLATLQQEISQQSSLQSTNVERYEQQAKDSEVSKGDVIVAAVMPGGFAYLFFKRMGAKAIQDKLTRTTDALEELSHDQLALLPIQKDQIVTAQQDIAADTAENILVDSAIEDYLPHVDEPFTSQPLIVAHSIYANETSADTTSNPVPSSSLMAATNNVTITEIDANAFPLADPVQAVDAVPDLVYAMLELRDDSISEFTTSAVVPTVIALQHSQDKNEVARTHQDDTTLPTLISDILVMEVGTVQMQPLVETQSFVLSQTPRDETYSKAVIATRTSSAQQPLQLTRADVAE